MQSSRPGSFLKILAIVSLIFACNAEAADDGELALVVNPDVTETHLTRSQLLGIFGMRLRLFSDEQPITVFVLPDDHPVHEAFCRHQLSVMPYKLRRAWNRLVFSGTGQYPNEVHSLQEMRERIATTPGAIGYLPKEMLDPSLRSLPLE